MKLQEGTQGTFSVDLGLNSNQVNAMFQENTETEINTETVSAQTESESRRDENIPLFEMSKGIRHVEDLWTEWHDGLGGKPSKSMDAKYGGKWRQRHAVKRVLSKKESDTSH
jgi:Transcriptional activator of glycolytic enzymes